MEMLLSYTKPSAFDILQQVNASIANTSKKPKSYTKP